jgi:hypothetical protein
MGIVDGGEFRGSPQSAFELMVLDLKLSGPIFGLQSPLAPTGPTAVDFLVSLPYAATVFAPFYRPFFPDSARLLDSTEILMLLSSHHAHPIDRKQTLSRVSRNRVADSNSTDSGEIPLGSNRAEKALYNLLEFSTA